MLIDTLRQIAETLYFSLECVDALQGKSFRYVFCAILHNKSNVFQQCVDFASETLTG